jgi:hypothetical protein
MPCRTEYSKDPLSRSLLQLNFRFGEFEQRENFKNVSFDTSAEKKDCGWDPFYRRLVKIRKKSTDQILKKRRNNSIGIEYPIFSFDDKTIRRKPNDPERGEFDPHFFVQRKKNFNKHGEYPKKLPFKDKSSPPYRLIKVSANSFQ